MTSSGTVAAPAGFGLGQPTPWRAINGLGLYVLLMYGITYYAVATAAPKIAQEFGANVSSIFGVLSVSLLLTALVAPKFGRFTDRFGPARMLLIGACARSLVLLALAAAPEFWSFAVALVALQLIGQITEYDATFAAAVELAGADARPAMSQITLWGGLASTAFWPLTALLLEHVGWRLTLCIYAALMMLVCVPIAALLPSRSSRSPQTGEGGTTGDPVEAVPPLAPVRPTATFVLLAAGFAFGGVAYNLPVLMLPVLEGLGLGAGALIVGMLFGPAQTAGRFFDLLFGRRVAALSVALIATAMLVVSLAVLLIGSQWLWTALLFAVLYGAGAGVSYVVRGSVVLELYGRTDYATWLGRLSTVRLVVSAASPICLALALETAGAATVVIVCLIASCLSFACFLMLRWMNGRDAAANTG